MNPGRELDQLVARKVMDLKEENGFYISLDCPHYSTSIQEAFSVVNRLRHMGSIFKLEICDGPEDLVGKPVYVTFQTTDDDEYTACCDTVPHAICLVALDMFGHMPIT